MNVKYFNITRQNLLIKEKFLKYVENILSSGDICMGKLCQEFEKKWAEINGAKYCSLVSSGTDALILTVDALNIKGLVLTPCLSFVATPNAITLNRQKILFCETDSNGNIDIKHAISRVCNQRIFDPVQAILAVGMYGGLPDMENLQKLAKSLHIPFILDAAQCHLAQFNDKHLIEYCDALVHSFYISKNLGCFTECGAVLTNNKELYEKICSLRNHGRGNNNYEFNDVGYNSRPSELSAASLLVKLPYIQEWTDRRIQIAKKYERLLKPLKDSGKLRYLEFGADGNNVKCVYHLFPIFVNGDRDKTRTKLLELGVETGCQYNKPLHLQKCYMNTDKRLDQGPFEIAEELCKNVITLPLYPEIVDTEINYVCEQVIRVLS